MKVTLTQLQRIVVALLYLTVLIVLFSFIDGNYDELLWKTSNDKRIWFFSGALLIILGKYVAEPFFSKPTDAITNAAAIIITLLTITDKDKFVFYEIVLIISLLVLVSSLTTIFLKNFNQEKRSIKRVNDFSYKFATQIGNSKVLFSLIYIPAIYSYFLNVEKPEIVSFVVLLAFWICLVFFDVIGKIVELFAVLFKKEGNIEEELGQAIGCENPLLYKVEVDLLSSKSSKIKTGDLVTVENEKLNKSIGIIINKKHLINKYWLEVYLLTDRNNNVIKIPQTHRLKYLNENKILQLNNSVKKVNSIDNFPDNIASKIYESKLYKKKDRFVGYIEKGSTINQIVFLHIGKNRINEGDIVVSDIYSDEVLFQLIDGQTREEPLEIKDSYGFEVAYARKLGSYNEEEKELTVRSWLPKMYSPVFAFKNESLTEEQLSEMANNSIGRLPKTAFEIPIKDHHSLVTHNTAILGILGIGKSRLTFELLKKLIENTSVKIICIDITNQYQTELNSYFEENILTIDLSEEERKDLKAKNKDGDFDNPKSWGNESEYITKLDKCISDFNNGDSRILILNPDWHNVSVAGSQFKITHKVELTVAQKTRIISERAFI